MLDYSSLSCFFFILCLTLCSDVSSCSIGLLMELECGMPYIVERNLS